MYWGFCWGVRIMLRCVYLGDVEDCLVMLVGLFWWLVVIDYVLDGN